MSDEESPDPKPAPASWAQAAATRHFRFGWWALFVFVTLGLVLEALNGLRVPWYLDVAAHTRRHMLTLAHAHGTLLALVNLAFAATLGSPNGERLGDAKVPSMCLLGAGVLLPAGFFAGGLVIYDGDPGIGIALVPVGALMLIAGTFLIAKKS